MHSPSGCPVKYIIGQHCYFVKQKPAPDGAAHRENIICLPGQPNRRQLSIRSESDRKGEMLMSTYEEFMIILAVTSLIVAILNLHRKK